MKFALRLGSIGRTLLSVASPTLIASNLKHLHADSSRIVGIFEGTYWIDLIDVSLKDCSHLEPWSLPIVHWSVPHSPRVALVCLFSKEDSSCIIALDEVVALLIILHFYSQVFRSHLLCFPSTLTVGDWNISPNKT